MFGQVGVGCGRWSRNLGASRISSSGIIFSTAPSEPTSGRRILVSALPCSLVIAVFRRACGAPPFEAIPLPGSLLPSPRPTTASVGFNNSLVDVMWGWFSDPLGSVSTGLDPSEGPEKHCLRASHASSRIRSKLATPIAKTPSSVMSPSPRLMSVARVCQAAWSKPTAGSTVPVSRI
jgi:hypothetical protein